MSSLPHVTAILRDAGLVDAQWFTDYARDRGTAVHLATALHDQGDLDEATIAPEIAPRLDAYRKFLAEVQPEILAVEEPVEYAGGYCGTLDRRVIIGGKEGVLDIKGGGPAPWHALQLQLYALCFVRYLKRWALYLTDDGYKLVEFTDRNDKAAALSAVTLAAWRRSHGLV